MIRVGIGGWVFPPWRGGNFYPADLPQARELAHASRRLTSIEINATFYGAQRPTSFRRWHSETPDDFVFSIKGPRFATHRKDLAGAKPSIDRFFGSGVLELGDKLGPFLWQLAPFKKFDPDDLAGFLGLLPREAGGRGLMHAIEVRHESFLVAEAVALLRKHNAAVVYADSDDYPAVADVTADFVYARLQRTSEEHPTGYSPADLDRWAARAKSWAGGGEPDDLPRFGGKAAAKKKRPVFVYMISGAKVRAPAAAMALIERVS
jgi:uncharacterized protein YecE (DUF72 family)